MSRLGAPVNGGTTTAYRQRAVTKHDTNPLALGPCAALYVGGAGDVAIVAEDDTDPIVWKAVPAGSIVPVRAKLVRSTDTTATDIIALYN